MPAEPARQYPYSWEEAIEILRNDPKHENLIYNAYLTSDLVDNGRRYAASDEFSAVQALLSQHIPGARRVLDMPGGNGIATYAFAAAGFEITTVEPNGSATVGRGAIRHVLDAAGLDARIVDAWGENLPFDDANFDVVFVRQGLHHASNLQKMLAEISRVLRPGGVLLACREHVVDDYGKSLEAFLASQVDHQLYGGEHAFTLADYRDAITGSGLTVAQEFGPYDTIINAFPNTPEVLREKMLQTVPGKILRRVLPEATVTDIGNWYLRRRKAPGRLFSFLASKTVAG